MLLRNSAKDGRKGNNLAQHWMGPYRIREHTGKACIDWKIFTEQLDR